MINSENAITGKKMISAFQEIKVSGDISETNNYDET